MQLQFFFYIYIYYNSNIFIKRRKLKLNCLISSIEKKTEFDYFYEHDTEMIFRTRNIRSG